jgi:hypothetical protein
VAPVDCEGVVIKLGKERPCTNRDAARKLVAVVRARWRYVLSRAASLTSSSLTGNVPTDSWTLRGGARRNEPDG